MKRIIGRAMSAALATGLLWPAQQLWAQLPTKTLTRPLAELSEPFTAVRGVRELADGRVIVADPRDKVVQLVDFKTGRATRIGREGSGPNEYQMPMSAFALPGDSTMIFDALNTRFLMLGPGGSLAGTWSPAAEAPAPVATTAPRPGAGGGGASFVMGGMGGGLSFVGARVTDAQGRLYLPGARFVAGPDGRPQSADSVPVLRMRRQSGNADTMAWLRVPKSDARVTTSGSAGNSNVSVRIGGSAFTAEDGWSVFPDGRVAVVRTADYHVDVYPASGRAAPTSGAPVRYTPVRVTEAEKQAWRDARRASPPMAIAVTRDGNAAQSTRSVSTAPVQDPDSWPAVMPAFQANQVHALPNGQLWVGRYTSANDKTPRFDVFDATGKHTGQVVLPPRTSIVGFGKGVIYTVRTDEDDLQYLQRFAIP